MNVVTSCGAGGENERNGCAVGIAWSHPIPGAAGVAEHWIERVVVPTPHETEHAPHADDVQE
jgi:hypothetical protein